jgi:mono/diheme cytochrome c family protein
MNFKPAVCILFSVAASCGAAVAQTTDNGAELYADYCATCHGAGGKGDGDMANVISIPASNLTTLASQNGGEFPMLKVIHIIDGRTGLRAHGGAMPVFGRVFSSQGSPNDSYGTVLESRGRILSLAMYLETIQQ